MDNSDGANILKHFAISQQAKELMMAYENFGRGLVKFRSAMIDEGASPELADQAMRELIKTVMGNRPKT